MEHDNDKKLIMTNAPVSKKVRAPVDIIAALWQFFVLR